MRNFVYKNKNTDRYYHSQFVDIKLLEYAAIFNDVTQIQSWEHRKMVLSEYDIVYYDIEVRRLKLEKITLISKYNNYFL